MKTNEQIEQRGPWVCEKARGLLEEYHPLLSLITSDVGFRFAAETNAGLLRLTVPRAGLEPIHGETQIPREFLEADDGEELEYELTAQVRGFGEEMARAISRYVRQEAKPLELAAAYEPPRSVAPRHFQCGDVVNLQGYTGEVRALDLENQTVIVGPLEPPG